MTSDDIAGISDRGGRAAGARVTPTRAAVPPTPPSRRDRPAGIACRIARFTKFSVCATRAPVRTATHRRSHCHPSSESVSPIADCGASHRARHCHPSPQVVSPIVDRAVTHRRSHWHRSLIPLPPIADVGAIHRLGHCHPWPQSLPKSSRLDLLAKRRVKRRVQKATVSLHQRKVRGVSVLRAFAAAVRASTDSATGGVGSGPGARVSAPGTRCSGPGNDCQCSGRARQWSGRGWK
jgi:hypothetical protein